MRLDLVLSMLNLSLSVTTEGGDKADVEGYKTDYDEYDSAETVDMHNAKATTATVKRTPKQKPKKEDYTDILKFLNTTEKIWVYQSTERTNDTCKVDDIEYVYELGACITRYHISKGYTNKTSTAVQFSYHWAGEDTSLPYHEMTVPNEEVLTPYETLVYQSKNNECGVFFMNFHRDFTDPDVWAELRIKNSSLLTGPDQECLKLFQDFSLNQSVTYNYTSECQRIFLSQAF
ncbi:uncharacterized protein LOC142587768 [Dermacentor variabilis]|uniref:uncharacterized protein LOC142587768 n=1 Tax=Dermacentor variabilis TaxID=34621 RepID=UPI003F5BFC84